MNVILNVTEHNYMLIVCFHTMKNVYQSLNSDKIRTIEFGESVAYEKFFQRMCVKLA